MNGTSHRVDGTRPADLAAAIRKLADNIEAGEATERHLGIVAHFLPVRHPECPEMIGDLRYTGETSVISTRPMPSDLQAAVQRFFNDVPVLPAQLPTIRFEAMNLIQLRAYRDEINAIIYDKERAQ